MAGTVRSGKPYTKEELQRAVAAVRENNLSIREASKLYKVPKSTLFQKCQAVQVGVHQVEREKPGPKPVLTEDEESGLVSWAISFMKRGFPRPDEALLAEVQKLLKADGTSTSTNNRACIDKYHCRIL